MRIRSAAVLAALFALGAVPASAQQSRIVFVGSVTDSMTGAPIVGATVTFQRANRTVFTDEKGAFRLKLPEGPDSIAVEQLGYHAAHIAVDVGNAATPRPVRLRPDPVALKGIAVINRNLSNRSAAIAMSVRSFNTKDLAMASAFDVKDYLESRGAYSPMVCPRAAFTTSCIWSRGQIVQPRVWLDNNRLYGGLDELATVPLQDLYRVDVFQRGVYIQVFTRWWLERALKHNEAALLPY